jgi:aminoglycoside phosphotransferase (APT) family kinase protein
MKACVSWSSERRVQPPFFESSVISDPGILTLPEVFDPVTMRKYLRQALPDRWGPIQTIRFHILKHHPGKRCTVEMALQTANGWDFLVGKVYACDRSDVYRAMQQIRRAGFRPAEEFSIPEPLAYVPELRLLLQEKVQGRRAKDIFLTDDERDRADASRRSARWLARFHAIAPQSGPIVGLTHHMDAAERWSQTIARLGEPVAGQARRLAKRLEEEAASVKERGVCAGHGSYNCNQIILTKDRTITLDWDGYDVTDPCRDVARFLVALQRLAFKYLGSIRALDAAAEAFLKTYEALSPSAVAASLPWYRALTCLRLAKYEANRPLGTFRHGIDALLGEGLRILER